MSKLWTSIAKRRGHKATWALLGVLIALGATAVAIAAGKADFSVAASPSSQTISAGDSATYTISITRLNGFTGSVNLSVSGLPAGATSTWSPSASIPSTSSTATLTIRTLSNTAPNTYFPIVTATSGNLSHTATVALKVQSATQANFTVAASPASQSVLQGDTTGNYSVNVAGSNWTGSVSLSTTGLPSGATASFDPSTVTAPNGSAATSKLTINTASNTPTGTYNVNIVGTGSINGTSTQRSTTVTVVVQPTVSFGISGSFASSALALYPGRTIPLNVEFDNPYGNPLQVTNLSVSLADATTKQGCSGGGNYTVTQFSGSYAITIPSGHSKLSDLVADSSKWPQLRMKNLSTNQDACKGAGLTLNYSGSATK